MQRHDVDGLCLAFGLLFTAFGLVLLGGDPAHSTISLPWAGPIAAIGVGLVVALAARPRRETAADPEPLEIED